MGRLLPWERMGRPILSPGKKLTGGKFRNSQFFPQSFLSQGKELTGQFFPLGKDLTSQFFPHPVSFSPMLFFQKRLENDICVIVKLNQIKYHSEIAVL